MNCTIQTLCRRKNNRCILHIHQTLRTCKSARFMRENRRFIHISQSGYYFYQSCFRFIRTSRISIHRSLRRQQRQFFYGLPDRLNHLICQCMGAANSLCSSILPGLKRNMYMQYNIVFCRRTVLPKFHLLIQIPF